MKAPKMIIDFSKYPGPVYTGRPRGEVIRAELKLDEIDESDRLVDVKIPTTTYSLTSSFFLGMFGPSVTRAGSQEAFFKKFHFETSPALVEAFNDYVARALQAKRLFN